MASFDFTKLGLFEFDGYDVFVDDYSKTNELGNVEHKVFIDKTGGAAAMLFPTDESLNFFKDCISQLGQEYTHRPIKSNGVILLARSKLTIFSQDCAEAVLYHEIAHLKLGHLVNQSIGIINNVQIEIEADAYAAEKTSQVSMLKVLSNIVRDIVKNKYNPDNGLTLKEATVEFLNDATNGFKARVESLGGILN